MRRLIISDSAAHFLLEIGNAGTEMDLPDLTPEAVRQALERVELKPLLRRFNAYGLYLLTGLLNRFHHQYYD